LELEKAKEKRIGCACTFSTKKSSSEPEGENRESVGSSGLSSGGALTALHYKAGFVCQKESEKGKQKSRETDGKMGKGGESSSTAGQYSRVKGP